MKTGLLARLLTTALLLAPCGSAWSQSNGTAAVQMRPDEAFWNAIRDGSKREQFELFLQVHPESPYAAEARRKIDALPAERQPAVAAEPIRPAAKPQPTLDATPATSPEPKTANPQNGSAAALSTLGALVHRSSLAKLGFILTEQGGQLIVEQVPERSPMAGLVEPGDRFVSLNGFEVDSLEELIKVARKAIVEGTAPNLTYLSYRLTRNGRPGYTGQPTIRTTDFGTALVNILTGPKSAYRLAWQPSQANNDAEFFANFALAYPADANAQKAKELAAALALKKPDSNQTAIVVDNGPNEDAEAANAKITEALKRFGVMDAAESTRLDFAIEAYRKAMRMPFDVKLSVKETRDLVENADAAETLRSAGFEGPQLGQFIDRAQLVYEQFLHELDKPPMKFLFLALQDHFDLPSTGKLDKSLIERVLEQKVTFESPKTRALKHGDWALTLADSNYGACFIKPDLTTISYSGAFLSDAPPQPKFLQFAAGEKPKFSDLYFGDISAFDASKPVVLQVGSQDFKLTADKHGSLVASNTDRAEILKSLAAQEQTVFVKGTSRMGGEVTYSFSTKELPATLDAFSAVCVQNDVPQTYGEWRFKRKPKGSAVAYLPDVKGFSVEVLCAYDDIWVIVEANKKKWPASLLKSKRTTMVMGNKGEPEYYFPDLTLGTQDEVAFFTGLTGNAAKKYADSLMKWDRSLLGFGSDEGILAYVTLPGKGSGKAIKAATDTCAALASK